MLLFFATLALLISSSVLYYLERGHYSKEAQVSPCALTVSVSRTEACVTCCMTPGAFAWRVCMHSARQATRECEGWCNATRVCVCVCVYACVQTWMRVHDYECVMTYDFQDAATLSEYATGVRQLPTARLPATSCTWRAAVNETAAEFICAASLPVVRALMAPQPARACMAGPCKYRWMEHAEQQL